MERSMVTNRHITTTRRVSYEMMASQYERWVGLVEVRNMSPEPKRAGYSLGFCTAIAWARDSGDFTREVSAALMENGVALLNVLEVETLASRRQQFSLTDPFMTLAETVSAQNHVAFCTFHWYLTEYEQPRTRIH